MKAYQYAKENGLSVAEVKEKFNLKSHMSNIPDEEEIAEVIVEVAKEAVDVVAETAKEILDSDVTKELIEASIRGVGSKSPYWHLRSTIGRE